MEEMHIAAGEQSGAENGQEEVTGDTLFERYEAGASLEELNDLLENSAEEEEGSHSEEDTGAAESESNGAIQQESQPEGGAQQETARNSSPDEGARKFTQKDVDYIIGKKTGEQARRHAALLDDLAAVLGVDRDKVTQEVRRQRYELEAEEKGISDKELYARSKQMERENAELLSRQREQESSRVFLDEIERQRLKMVSVMPDFDMAKAVENERFVNTLSALYQNPETKDSALELAWRAVYFSEETQKIAAREREKIISAVKSGQARATEGAAAPAAAASSKINVEKMTDEQIAELSQRILNGEKISF